MCIYFLRENLCLSPAAMLPWFAAAGSWLFPQWAATQKSLPFLDPHVDHSPSLMVDRGLIAIDDIWSKDSWNNPRLVCDLHPLNDEQVIDRIPSWLTAADGGETTQTMMTTALAAEDDHIVMSLFGWLQVGSLNREECMVGNIVNHPQWQILYYFRNDPARRMTADVSAIEILRRHGMSNVPRVIYFSRESTIDVHLNQEPMLILYVIREKRSIDYLPECIDANVPGLCFSVLDAVINEGSFNLLLSFDLKSEIARTMVEGAMLLRNHWIVIGDLKTHMSETKIFSGYRFFPATVDYRIISPDMRHSYAWSNYSMYKLVAAVAYLLHGNICGDGQVNTDFAWEGADNNRFARSAFFAEGITGRQSYSFDYMVDAAPLNFRFKSLREVIGNDPDLAKIDARILAKGFSLYYEHLKEHLYSANEYQPGSIKSIREFLLNYAIVV